MTTPEPKAAASSFRAPGASDWRELVAEIADDKEQQEKARTAKDELKNVLLASLQMQHLVILAGSGCSRSAGGPSMQDLWNGAVGAEPTVCATETAGKVNHDLKDQNIEAFLSRVEAFLQVEDNEDVSEFLSSSKQVILDKCSAFLDADKLGAYKVFLHRLSRRRVRDQRLQVFTTNYDLCFERAAAELGGVALDGFSFTAPRRYDPRFFGYDIIRRPRSGDDLGHYLEGVFLLYKLHGSVNWARGEEGTIYEKDKPTPAEACLIYPARGKYQQSFVQPHLESMAQYLAAIREPNTCLLAVGFGFNDDHLAEPLLAAAQSNPHLRLIIVDKEAHTRVKEAADSRFWKTFAELGGRGEDVWFIKASFGDFAQMVPDLKSLTPADTLMKAIKGVTREL
ncbi:MAG: SIR2 family protein [Candidatus Eisenbacteria bacterium]|uniref:SIR2 family protein n=1 Tax=Eiseniibacteriota bacterium TaxID=2212470 RepID=A0A948W6L3_UNCEI|nr:SIR2 family protein [Candidatus Eisenbacteria bacterium]MBU2691255.1 SIR2 family protein [Candidatus Eisenbacteria bacterium]